MEGEGAMCEVKKAMMILAGLSILLLAGPAWAQESHSTGYEWTAPLLVDEEGLPHKPAVAYVVQHRASVDSSALWNHEEFQTVDTVTDTIYALEAEWGKWHQIRVGGLDDIGRQGPWTEPPDPRQPELPPLAPGQPCMIIFNLITGRAQ